MNRKVAGWPRFAPLLPAKPALPRWLPDALIIIAGLRLLGALIAVPAILTDFGAGDTEGTYPHWVAVAELIATPLTAGAALIWALRLQYRKSIVALALVMLAAWLGDLVAIPVDGLEWSVDPREIGLLFIRVFYPLAGLTAIVLALRDRGLPIAFALVALPMTFQILIDMGTMLSAMISAG